jgi:hypothetical protein
MKANQPKNLNNDIDSTAAESQQLLAAYWGCHPETRESFLLTMIDIAKRETVQSGATPSPAITQTPCLEPVADVLALALESAHDARNLAELGRLCTEEFSTILMAIVKIGPAGDLVHSIAKMGVRLADDQHNNFDCEHDNMTQKLMVLNRKNYE